MHRGLKDITAIDFSDVDDVARLAALLLDEALCGKGRDAELAATGQKLCETIRSIMDASSPGEALRLIEAYDMAHRAVYGHPAEAQSVNDVILRAFESRIAGDETIDVYDLYCAIGNRLRQHDQAFAGRPLRWNCLNLDRWWNNFRYGAICLTPQSDYDTRRQTEILLSEDLSTFTAAQHAFKQQLINNHGICSNPPFSHTPLTESDTYRL